MKIILLFVMLSIIPSGLMAQKKEEFKPVDYSKGELGANFKGHPVIHVASALNKKASPKGEFEKTVEYEARLAKLETEPLLGSVMANDTFIFPLESAYGLEKKYDADSEEMLLKFSAYRLTNLYSFTQDYQSYNCGIDLSVIRSDIRKLGVTDEFKDISISFALPPKEARQLKDRLSIAICFKFEKPYLHHEPKPGGANVKFQGTIQNIFVYDPVTGHIYKKI